MTSLTMHAPMRLLALPRAPGLAGLCALALLGPGCSCPFGHPGSDAAAPSDAGDAAGPDAAATDAALDSGGPPSDAGLLGLGEPCASGSDCASGVCWPIVFSTELRCTASCDAVDATCPPGGVCFVPGDAAGSCLRLCDPALDDCPAGLTCTQASPDEWGCYL